MIPPNKQTNEQNSGTLGVFFTRCVASFTAAFTTDANATRIGGKGVHQLGTAPTCLVVARQTYVSREIKASKSMRASTAG